MVEKLESVIARQEAPKRVIARKEKQAPKEAPEPMRKPQVFAKNF